MIRFTEEQIAAGGDALAREEADFHGEEEVTKARTIVAHSAARIALAAVARARATPAPYVDDAALSLCNSYRVRNGLPAPLERLKESPDRDGYRHRAMIMLDAAGFASDGGVPVVESLSIDERWGGGVPHDPRSYDLYRWISVYDREHGGDALGLRAGGDGDNGEHLMYILDEYFTSLDTSNGAVRS